MNKIVISVTNDLVTDQRVIRTCECFNELGYEILLIGRKMKRSPDVKFPFHTLRFELIFNRGFLFYAEYNLRLFFKLIFSKKDIVYANDLDTLLANFLISKITSCKLIYDSHEYFTEVPELISRPRVRSFWLKLENYIFPRLKNVITVNDKIASLYSAKYMVPVSVVRNVPRIMNANESVSVESLKKDQKTIIYQGSLNIGRGLELMIDTMPFLKSYALIIVGDGDISKQLKARVKQLHLQHQVFFLGRILPKELIGITKQADLGISLEEDLGLNYRYCLPNKIFDYIQAGIPVLVSDLPLLKNLVECFKIGEYLSIREPKSLAMQIESVVENKIDYEKGITRASQEYNWNKEKKLLIDFIDKIE